MPHVIMKGLRKGKLGPCARDHNGTCRYGKKESYIYPEDMELFKKFATDKNDNILAMKLFEYALSKQSGILTEKIEVSEPTPWKKNKNPNNNPYGSLRKNGNRYQVLIKENKSLGIGDTWYTFGNLTTDISLIKKLHIADPNKNYQNGECGVIAGDLYKKNDFVKEYWYLATNNDPEFGIHQFVELHDGTLVDSMGIWTKEEMLKTWQAIDPTCELKILEEEPPEGEEDWKPGSYPNETPLSSPQLYDTIVEMVHRHLEDSASSQNS